MASTHAHTHIHFTPLLTFAFDLMLTAAIRLAEADKQTSRQADVETRLNEESVYSHPTNWNPECLHLMQPAHGEITLTSCAIDRRAPVWEAERPLRDSSPVISINSSGRWELTNLASKSSPSTSAGAVMSDMICKAPALATTKNQ